MNNQDAQKILESSCLNRRKLSAVYRLSVKIRFKEYGFLLVLVSAIFILVFLLFQIVFQVRFASVPLPSDQPTPAGRFDRFCFIHTVRKGDTFWGISTKYYGAATAENFQKLREANTWLPEKPEKLDEGKTIKVPLKKDGCPSE